MYKQQWRRMVSHYTQYGFLSCRVQRGAVQTWLYEDLQILWVFSSRQRGGFKDQTVCVAFWWPDSSAYLSAMWRLSSGFAAGSVRQRRWTTCGSTSQRTEAKLQWVEVPCKLQTSWLHAGSLFYAQQVFDATNTTRERRETIIQFAEQNGFKVTCWLRVDVFFLPWLYWSCCVLHRCFLWNLCVKTQMSFKKTLWWVLVWSFCSQEKLNCGLSFLTYLCSFCLASEAVQPRLHKL